MKKDFDFDDIGKRTPYRTPDGFFEDVQRKVMERAGVKQQRNHIILPLPNSFSLNIIPRLFMI